MARDVDQPSRATQTHSVGPMVTTCSPGLICTVSECPWFQPALAGESRSGPMARGVDQLTRATHTRSDGLQGGQAVPGNTGPPPSAHGVDQLFWATWARVRGHAGSTSCLRRLALGPDGPRGLPAVPGDLGLGPKARSRPAVPGDLGPCPMSRWVVPRHWGPGWTYRCVDQASLATWARAQMTSGWTSCHGQFGTVPKASRGKQVTPGHSGPCPRAHGVNQQYWETRTYV